MNEKRRKMVAQALEKLQEARKLISDAKDGEQEALDETPEELQDVRMLEYIEQLEDIMDTIDSLITDLEAM